MKKKVFLSVIVLLLLSNRCAPSLTIFEIQNNLAVNLVVFSKNDIHAFQNDLIDKSLLYSRIVKKQNSNLIYLKDYELKDFFIKDVYVFYLMKYTTDNRRLIFFKKIVVPKSILKVNSKENYFIVRTNKEIEILLEK